MTRQNYLTLAQINEMDPAGLAEEWARRYGVPAPNLSPDLLRLGLAYRLQEQRQGGLTRSTKTVLRKASEQSGKPERAASFPRKLNPGTRLVRDWHGVGHTGERIRDKIAASKRKGIWMGGPVPLGYVVVERKLLPQPEEAERVRSIMQRYLEVRSVPALLEVLASERVVTKIQQRSSGPHRGGIPFARGSLFHLLKNPVYRGKIVHKGQVYDGEHEPIVDEGLCNAVQAQLQENAPPRRRSTNMAQRAMLAGLLSDPQGRPVVPTYGTNGTRRYTYYATRKDLARPGSPKATSFQRGQLEQHLLDCLRDLLTDEHELRRLTGIGEAGTLLRMFDAASALAQDLGHPSKAHGAIRKLLLAARIGKDRIHLDLNASALGLENPGIVAWAIPIPARLPFREAKIRIDAEQAADRRDKELVDLLADAMEVRRLVLEAPDLSLNQLGQREGRCRTHLAKLLRLSWLSPRIVEAVVEGTHPARMTWRSLVTATIQPRWEDQERQFGFAA